MTSGLETEQAYSDPGPKLSIYIAEIYAKDFLQNLMS